MKTHVEFLRIAAAFLVIVNHTNSDIFLTRAPSPTWFCSLTYFFICKTAVPLFLYIMGGLLLGKKDSPKKTAERLLHSFIVLTAASACYYIYYAHQRNTETGLGDFLQGLFKKNVSVALWYLYLYLGLLCLLPILQRLAQALSRRQLEYLLFLSLGVCGTAPLITVFWPDFVLSGYFTAGLIGPYIGQVMLGYYIERYVPMRKKVFWPALCGFVLLIVFQVAGTFLLYRRDPSSYTALDNRTFITITGSAACLYICVKYLFAKYPPGPRVSQAVCRLGRLTFGIYLMADMARTQFSAPVYGRMIAAGLHPLVAMVLWELFIFTVCALATAALRLVPPLRKWL